MMYEGWNGGSNILSPALVLAIAPSGLSVEVEEDTYEVQQNPRWDWTSMSERRSSFPVASPSRNDASDPPARVEVGASAHLEMGHQAAKRAFEVATDMLGPAAEGRDMADREVRPRGVIIRHWISLRLSLEIEREREYIEFSI